MYLHPILDIKFFLEVKKEAERKIELVPPVSGAIVGQKMDQFDMSEYELTFAKLVSDDETSRTLNE